MTCFNRFPLSLSLTPLSPMMLSLCEQWETTIAHSCSLLHQVLKCPSTSPLAREREREGERESLLVYTLLFYFKWLLPAHKHTEEARIEMTSVRRQSTAPTVLFSEKRQTVLETRESERERAVKKGFRKRRRGTHTGEGVTFRFAK